MASFLNTSIESVRYHIENQDFEGPLDLLVQMVKESKIDILNFFISDITEQYIAFVKTMNELDYEYVAQYVVLAATLMEIKSFRMMPFEEEDDFSPSLSNYEEEINESELSILREIEERIARDMPEKLKPLEMINVFDNEPEFDEADYKLVGVGLTIDKLTNAFKQVLEAEMFQKPVVEKVLRIDTFTVAQKASELTKRLKKDKRLTFFSLFEPQYRHSEILGVFLAILELLKKQIATAEQESETQDIIISYNTEYNEAEGEAFSDINYESDN